MITRERQTILSQTIQDGLNEQINAELYASHLYLSMAAYCEWTNLTGFAHWFNKQSKEEMSHAIKLFNFVNDREGRVVLRGLPQPPTEFQSVLHVMECALDHEREVSRSYQRLYDRAVQEDDRATQVHLQWFISEQVEEEKEASLIVQQLKMFGDKGEALFLMDQKLGQRKEEG